MCFHYANSFFMKHIILGFFITFLVLFQAYANENSFIIKGYKLVPDMDYQLELVMQNPAPNQKLLLDCQSFINGLVKLEYTDSVWENVGFFMLSGNDCDEAAQFGIKAQEMSLPYCLKLNFEKFKLDLSYELSKCEIPD